MRILSTAEQVRQIILSLNNPDEEVEVSRYLIYAFKGLKKLVPNGI